MITPLQTNSELREWQKKFNPTQPLNAPAPAVKRTSSKNNNKYLQQGFFSR